MHLVLLEKSEIGIETSLKRNVQALQKDLEEKDEQYRNVVNQLQEIRSAELEQKLTDALRNAGTMEDQVKQLRFELTLFQDHLHSNQSQPTITKTEGGFVEHELPIQYTAESISESHVVVQAQRSASISLNGSSNERFVQGQQTRSLSSSPGSSNHTRRTSGIAGLKKALDLCHTPVARRLITRQKHSISPSTRTYRNAKGSGIFPESQQRDQTDMSIDDEEVEAEDTVASRVVLS
ncbi:hypothetical protein EV359DRAFT_88152 [Lentinula novae-zelandiae]|nr:hypothetical protein EV359DRAFT_88152 [Lentinula novae-zelandiae]